MDINLADVTLHIDETLPHEERENVADAIRGIEGVVAVASHDERPHLMVVEYDPNRTSSQEILSSVKGAGFHAELVGL